MTKTLYDKIKPEIREAILKDQNKYPHLIGELIQTLKTKNFTIQLTLGEVNDVKSYAPKYVETILQVYEMFEPPKEG
tara:strand:+ start:19280 stop:19510 length:231 start_codon:yes stop_codon:yes gene_type:complete